MNEIIEIKRASGIPSRVVVGNVLANLADYLPHDRRVVVVTDRNVHRLHGSHFDAFEHVKVGEGEGNKTIAAVERLYSALIDLGVDRECFLLGVGGGIVTDIAGFAASTYMRGLPFGFVASTLLAQVDAAIGGKNGVNVGGYKNMTGTFNQPEFVLCDPAMLETLPVCEMRCGMAEIIKAAVIADPELFSTLESEDGSDPRRDGKLESIITSAIRVKAAIVDADEHEKGIRRTLNLGHTFAHAIEKLAPGTPHGEAVAAGIVTASDLAVRMGKLPAQTSDRIRKLIVSFGLPTDPGIDKERIFGALRHDKKKDADHMNLVVPVSIGQCEVVRLPITELGYLYL